MSRVAPADLFATGLACGAAALGLLAGSGPLMPLLGALVVLAGVVRARVALAVALFCVAPLIALTGGLDHLALTFAGLALAASAAAFLVGDRRPAVPIGEDGRLAAAIVLAVALVGTAGALARFAILFV